MRRGHFQQLIHQRLFFADAEAADGIAGDQPLAHRPGHGAGDAQIFKHAALHNAEKRLLVRIGMRGLAALCPVVRAAHGR